MAHNLNFEDGQASMFSVGEVPWHGLGKILDHPPTASEAIRHAQMDWRVKKINLFAIEGAKVLNVQNKYAIVREDKWGTDEAKVLGVVSDKYEIFQNVEAFSYFDPWIESGAMTYETAGMLGDGERIWVMGKLSGDLVVGDADKVEKYLLFTTSHDGSSSIRIKFTPIRVVCQNTLDYALSSQNRGQKFIIQHNRSMRRRIEESKALLEEVTLTYKELGESYQKLYERVLTKEEVLQYYTGLFHAPDESKYKTDVSGEKAMAKHEERMNLVRKLNVAGPGNKTEHENGTAWTAYNAVTDYVDHYSDRDGEKKLKYVWSGDGATLKRKAFGAAVNLAQPRSKASDATKTFARELFNGLI